MSKLGRVGDAAPAGGPSPLSLERPQFNHEAYRVIALWREKEGYAERRAAWLQRFSTGTLLNIGRR